MIRQTNVRVGHSSTRIGRRCRALGALLLAAGFGGGCSEGITPPEATRVLPIGGGTFQMGLAEFDPCRTFKAERDTARPDVPKLFFGCAPADEAEMITHTATVDNFCIDEHEVTVRQYHHCVETGPCNKPKMTNVGNPGDNGTTERYYSREEKFSDYPAVGMEWADARIYCEWRGGRLPTEVEWEFAARSRGTRADVFAPDDATRIRQDYETDTCSDARGKVTAGACGGREILPVRSSTGDVTAQGVHDMAGSVQEWVADPLDLLAYCAPQQPTGALTSLYEVEASGAAPRVRPAVGVEWPSALVDGGDTQCLAVSDGDPARRRPDGGCYDAVEFCVGVCGTGQLNALETWQPYPAVWRGAYCSALHGAPVSLTVRGLRAGVCEVGNNCCRDDDACSETALAACEAVCECVKESVPAAPESANACLRGCFEAWPACADGCVTEGVAATCGDGISGSAGARPVPRCVPRQVSAETAHRPHSRPDAFGAGSVKDRKVIRGAHFQEREVCNLRPTRRSSNDRASPRVGFRCAYDFGTERCR